MFCNMLLLLSNDEYTIQKLYYLLYLITFHTLTLCSARMDGQLIQLVFL